MQNILHNYNRYIGESDEELIFRVCKDKDEIGSWQEVANILNELLNTEYTESKFRKSYQAFQKMFLANQSKFLDIESQLNELKEERLALEKQKIQVRDERNELKRIIREEARKESFKDQIIRNIKEYQSCPLNYDNSKKFTGVLKSDNDLIVSLMDVHCGIEIENYFNTFNHKVLRNRLNQYLDKIFEIQLRHGSENAHVILSELINGLIHTELRIESNQDVLQQFLTVIDCIAQFLTELSYHFNLVYVYICPGNHSRITTKKEDSLKGENIDHLALPFLEAKLQNFENIICNYNEIEESIAMFSVRNNVIMASHGDKDEPSNVVQKFTLLFGIRPALIYLGHRHKNGMSTVYATKVIESGTLSGTDNFALDHRLNTKPSQSVSVITEKGLDCLYNVEFD